VVKKEEHTNSNLINLNILSIIVWYVVQSLANASLLVT